MTTVRRKTELVNPKRKSLRFLVVVICVFLLHLLFRWEVVFNPPYWDGIQGPFLEAIWLLHNDFDYWQLVTKQEGFIQGGPAIYIWSILPSIYALLYKLLEIPSYVFFVLHLTNFLLAGVILASADYLLTTHLRSTSSSALVGILVLLSHPTFGGQIDGLTMAIPVAFGCIILGALAIRQKWILLGLVGCFAIFIKDSITIVLVANIIYVLFAVATGQLKGSRTYAAIGANLLPLIIRFAVSFIIVSLRAQRDFENPNAYGLEFLSQIDKVTALARGAYPETYAILVFAIIIFSYVTSRAISRKGWSNAIGELSKTPAWMLTFYSLLVSCGYVMYQTMSWTTPRYIVWFWAFFVLAFIGSLALLDLKNKTVVAILSGLCIIHLLNTYGTFRPGYGHTTFPLAGDLLERSREYLGDLESERDVCRYIEKNAGDRTIICHRNFDYQLTTPEFGYVEIPIKVAASQPTQNSAVQDFKELPKTEVLDAWFIHKPNGMYTVTDPTSFPPTIEITDVTFFPYKGERTRIFTISSKARTVPPAHNSPHQVMEPDHPISQ